MSLNRPYRLAIVVTHPIQYMVPIYRALAADPEIQLKVFFASDHSIRGGFDNQFGVNVTWDIPLLEGYEHEFLGNFPRKLKPRSFWEFRTRGLRQALKRGNFDAVLASGYASALDLQAVFAANSLKLPVMLRGDSNELTRRKGMKDLRRTAFLHWYYRRISAGLAVGSYMIDHFVRNGIPRERVFFSPHCVDNARLREQGVMASDAQTTRKELGLSDCDLVLIYCGKLIPVKAPLVLAGALQRMQHRQRVGLLVVGAGELMDEMRQAVANSGIRASAFVGFKNQSELPKYYKTADALVLCSEFETWGLVVNEAMNFKLPAILSDHVGCWRDLVESGVTGYVFPSGNVDALAGHLDALVENPEATRRMGDAAKRRIDAFGPEAAAAGIKNAMKAILPPQ